MTHGDIMMEKVTNPNVQDLLELLARLDPAELQRRYPEIVTALQARMQQEQEPFV
jgi:hypothetical protein